MNPGSDPMPLRLLRVLCLLLLGLPPIAAGAPFDAAVAQLDTSNFRAKALAITAIEATGDPRASVILQALLDAALYTRRDDRKFVIGRTTDAGFELVDPFDGKVLGPGTKSALKKVAINNQLRVQLRSALARQRLRDPDPTRRVAAAYALMSALTPDTVAILRARLAEESAADVKTALGTVIALADLSAADASVRERAVHAVAGSMRDEVRNRLAALLEKNAAGVPVEPDRAVRMAAAAAVRDIDSRRAFYGFVETVFFGLSLGFVLVLAATGLAITFGVMGVINMAHGELMMLGAYTTYVVQQALPGQLGLGIALAIPAAFLVAGAAGIAIERGVVRFLYGRPLETLLATFGISLVLQQLVRTIFSPLNRAIETPAFMSGQWAVNDALSLTLNRLYIIGFSVGVFCALLAILRYSSLGLQVRAVAQNRAMARAMGVRAGWIDAATFGLGSGVAGLAGVALSQLTNVGPNLGQAYIVDSFMVVVFGGVGNLWGTLVAGLSLGIANKFLEPYAGAVLAKILVLGFIILFIQRWPRGLFPPRGRAAEG